MIFRLPLLLGALLLVGFTGLQTQPKPFDPVQASNEGRALVAEILSQQPAQNFTNTGVLKIGRGTETQVRFETLVNATNWHSNYEATWSNRVEKLSVVHAANQANAYFADTNQLVAGELSAPFAGSDFWRCDLGLEFFHWPDQKILKTELRKTRFCKVLESINPEPTTNGYSRVVLWIDTESLGIIHADAYDAAGKLLKEFDPKTVKEVNGQPQLVKMEMYNRQTHSRSQIEFNFDSK